MSRGVEDKPLIRQALTDFLNDPENSVLLEDRWLEVEDFSNDNLVKSIVDDAHEALTGIISDATANYGAAEGKQAASAISFLFRSMVNALLTEVFKRKKAEIIAEREQMVAKREREARMDLIKKSEIDQLTDVYNLSYLIHHAPLIVENCWESARPLAVMFIDMDFFKKINDEHGHERGDEALRWFAQLLQKNVRPKDHVIRKSGDEFIILCPDVDPHNACRLALRLLQKVQKGDGSRLRYGASIGISCMRPADYDETFTNLDDQEEDDLFSAKKAFYTGVFEDMKNAADYNLYIVKGTRTDRYGVFADSVRGQVAFNGQMITENTFANVCASYERGDVFNVKNNVDFG